MRDESKCEYRCLVCLPPQSSEVAEGCSIAELSDHHPWGGSGRRQRDEAFSEPLATLPGAHLGGGPAARIYQLLWHKD